MKKRKTKALALLAGLGIVGNSSALDNAPIQELNATVQHIYYLSKDRTKTAELMQAVEKLTTTLNTLNELITNKLDHIDKTGFQLLDTLNGYLNLSFELVKSLVTEEEAFTIYYKQLRPFSKEITRLTTQTTTIKDRLGLIKTVNTGVMSNNEIKAMIEQLDEVDRNETTARN